MSLRYYPSRLFFFALGTSLVMLVFCFSLAAYLYYQQSVSAEILGERHGRKDPVPREAAKQAVASFKQIARECGRDTGLVEIHLEKGLPGSDKFDELFPTPCLVDELVDDRMVLVEDETRSLGLEAH